MKTPFRAVIFLISRYSRRFVVGCGLLLLFVPTIVEAQLSYTITTNLTVTITGYTGPGGTVTIPETINGLPVTRIADSAFKYQSNVTSFTIPDGVTDIGPQAFASCAALTNIDISSSVTTIGGDAFSYCPITSFTIPDSVTNLGAAAFWDCVNLTNVDLGNGLRSIDSSMFYNCSSLTVVRLGKSLTNTFDGQNVFAGCYSFEEFTVETNNPAYSSLNGVLYDKNGTTLIQYPYAKAGNYTIPSSVKTILSNACSVCFRLTGVTIPNSVTTIGDQAFEYCTSLTSIFIPNCSMGSYVFDHCLTLSNVVINVPAVGDYAFYNCTLLASVTMMDTVTNIGTAAFAGCTNLSSVPIANSVTSIGDNAFRYCSNLTSLTIPKYVSQIGGWAFGDCTKLASVYFQGDAPSVGPNPFYNDNLSIIYHVPGALGWTSTLAGRPALPISMQIQTGDGGFGVRSNQFGFNITGTYGLAVVVEAATDLAKPTWYPLQTNTLDGSSVYFSDPQWTNYPNRFYRVRWP